MKIRYFIFGNNDDLKEKLLKEELKIEKEFGSLLITPWMDGVTEKLQLKIMDMLDGNEYLLSWFSDDIGSGYSFFDKSGEESSVSYDLDSPKKNYIDFLSFCGKSELLLGVFS